MLNLIVVIFTCVFFLSLIDESRASLIGGEPGIVSVKSYNLGGPKLELPFKELKGFHSPEGQHIWTADTQAEIHLDPKDINQITLVAVHALAAPDKKQTLRIYHVSFHARVTSNT